MAGRKQATMASAAAVALLLVAAVLAIVSVAPAAATNGYTMCGVDLNGMKGACEKYCTRGSREAWPGKPCCDAVSGADFDCLCRLKRAIGSVGNIDAGRAMQIPSKCRIPNARTSC